MYGMAVRVAGAHVRMGLVCDRLENPSHPEFEYVFNDITQDYERKYDPNNNRAKVRAFAPLFSFCNMVLLVRVMWCGVVLWFVWATCAWCRARLADCACTSMQ